MAESNHTSTVPVFKPFVIFVCIICPLTASAFMGAKFLQSLGTGANGWILLLGAGSLLASSALLGTMSGRCKAKGSNAIASLCLLAWLVIVIISTSTSALSLLDTSGDTIKSQVMDSPEYNNIQSTIADNRAIIKSNQRTIDGLQQQIDGRDPVRWATRRSEWAAEISAIQDQNKGLSKENRVLINNQTRLSRNQEGSTVATAFARIGGLIGVSGEAARLLVILLFAVALDLLPFTAGCSLGFLYGHAPAKKQQAAVKKGKPNLKAVA